ncbi:MAG: hypothetical protein KF862_07185 [Chitinophagaceae bacterium]|nr:hypothetical protein [Chitinophagaceae bacterium]
MVNQPIIISTIATTKHIIAVLYYNNDPLIEVARVVKAPGDDNTNYMFVGVNPGAATVRWYESDNGTDLTTALGSFQLNISEKKAVLEERFYYVDRGRVDEDGNVYDPISGERSFTDSYLDGKILTSLNKRGSGPTEEGIEWIREGNTVTILNPENQEPDGPVFAENDVWVGMISYLQEVIIQTPQQKVYYDEITEDTVLTYSHRNKWLYLKGSSTRLKLTAESIGTIPDGDWYGVICNGGNQFQTVFEAEDGDAINVNGQDKPRVVIGRFERWKIFKRGSKFEILEGLDFLPKIGSFFKSYMASHINALWTDGLPRNGDDYPRIYDIIQDMPSTVAINSPTVVQGKEASWYWWESGGNKYFRTPNKQNGFGRNLKSFENPGTDITRKYPTISGDTVVDLVNDYPGGRQYEEIGPHRHFIIVPSGQKNSQFPYERGGLMNKMKALLMWWEKSGGGAEGYYTDGSDSEPSVGRTSSGHIQKGTQLSPVYVANNENRPTNHGEYEFVWI